MSDWLTDLRANWMPGDPVRPSPSLDAWLRLRFDVVTRLRPTRIVEIGVRAGYSAYAMLSAAPGAEYVGIDIRADAHGGRVGAHEHAVGLLSRFPHVSFVHADSRTLDTLTSADLIHIDGDHSEEGCRSDIDLARRGGIPWALVDDTNHIRAVRSVVESLPPDTVEWFDDGHRGAALVRLS